MTMNAFKQRGGMAVAMLAAAVALSACGGGKQVKKFSPSNIVSFGDESSAFVPDTTLETGTGTIKGLKYTVNLLEYVIPVETSFDPKLPDGATINSTHYPVFPTDTPVATAVGSPAVLATGNAITSSSAVIREFTMDAKYTKSDGSTATNLGSKVTYKYVYNCGDGNYNTAYPNPNRLWIQRLADAYGMSYNLSCPLDPRGKAVTYAAAGAKVADVVLQISNNLAAVNSNTLVTVLAGQNDVMEKYEALYTAASSPPEGSIRIAEAELKTRGKQLGQAVNTLASQGARTLVVTVPDLSYSPFVGADAGKQAVMRRLLVAFNEAIFDEGGARVDGHYIGLVNGFDVIGSMARSPSAFDLIDVSSAACDTTKGRSIDTVAIRAVNSAADLKYCSTKTLVTGATAFNYLWAFDSWLAPSGHGVLANAAFARADNDTF